MRIKRGKLKNNVFSNADTKRLNLYENGKCLAPIKYMEEKFEGRRVTNTLINIIQSGGKIFRIFTIF